MIKELTELERMKLALKYSRSEKHSELLRKRIEDYDKKLQKKLF